jgi:protein phosphatase PTC7
MKLLSIVLIALSQLSAVAFVSGPIVAKNSLASSSSTCLFDAPEALETEGNWQAFLDEGTTGLVYYFDVSTGESLWEPPTETFPDVRLPRKKQRLADSLRKEYRKSLQKEEEKEQQATATAKKDKNQQKQEAPNWIEGLFDEVVVAAAVETAEKAPAQQGSWLDRFAASKTEVAAVKIEVVEKKPLLNIFPKKEVDPVVESAVNGDAVVTKEEVKEKKGFMDNFFAPPTVQMQTEEKVSAPKKDVAPEIEKRPIKLEMSAYVSPHPAKVRWGGEDAVFTKGRSFGVFDGVSGAEKIDGLPLYSKTLALEMKKMCSTGGMSIAEMSLYLTEAAEYADNCSTGASTAVVASIGENGFLQALNLGDSGCIVVRGGRVTAKTRDISHYFECPYQLSEDSPDRPKDGTKLNVELIAGDIVIMASDGIFDNLREEQILETAGNGPRRSSVIAKRIVDLSRKVSLDENAATPYAKQAMRRGDSAFRNGLGGKLDDASCIVVLCD